MSFSLFEFIKRKIFSAEKFLLFIGDDSAIFLHINNDHEVIYRLSLFDVHDLNSQDLFACLKKNPGVPFYISVNKSEQKYILKNIPHLSLFGCDIFMQMKLKEDFPAFDLRECNQLNDQSGHFHKNECVVALLSNGDYLNAWISAIMSYTKNLKGLCFFPLALSKVLPHIIPEDTFNFRNRNAWSVFVIMTKVSGFTHMVFRGSDMIYACVIPVMNDVKPNILIGGVYQDLENIFQYLKKFGFSGSNMNTCFVVPSNLKVCFSKVENPLKSKLTVIDSKEFAQIISVSDVYEDDVFADTAACVAILKNIKSIKFSRTENTSEFYYLCLLDHYVPVISYILCFLLLVFGSFSLLGELFQTKGEIVSKNEIEFLEQQIDTSNGNYSMERLNRTNELISMYKALKSIDHQPLAYIKALNNIDFHSFRVIGFNWLVNKQNNKLQIFFDFVTRADGAFFSRYENLSKELQKLFPQFDLTSSRIPDSVVSEKELVHVTFYLR